MCFFFSVRDSSTSRIFPVLVASMSVACAFLMTSDVGAQQVTTDLWDWSRGARMHVYSQLHNGFSAEDMFGTRNGFTEPGNTVFVDQQPAGTIHWIEWEPPAPVTIERFRFFAQEDSPDSNLRSLDHVRLLALVDDAFEAFYEDDIASPYGYREFPLLRYEEIAPVTAQRFRAEFRQHIPPGFSGPRILELDGFPAAICADVNYDGLVSASDALITLQSAVGSASCEHCVCDVIDQDGDTAADALFILQLAVGQLLSPDCPSCAPVVATTTLP